MLFEIVFSFISLFSSAISDDHDHYHGHHAGDDHHGDFYGGFEIENKCTTGMEQSPINLEDLNFEFHDVSSDLQFKNFDVLPLAITLSNTHDSVNLIFTWPKGLQPSIWEHHMDSNFLFAGMHLHWGSNDEMGSEHQINGVRYPIEAHLLFYHESQKSMDEALNRDEKGLKSVMAVFGRLTDDRSKYVMPYTRSLKHVIRAHSDYVLPKKDLFTLSAMLPSNVSNSGYYHYDGSLTTPPCTEGIGWLVLTEPFKLSNCDIKAFRKLEDDDGNLISGNFRTVQPLVERVIKVAT